MKEQKLNFKIQRGITLIALVITIIVLLILAGVSIATLMGDNGILTQAATAKERNEIEEIKEKIKIEIMGVQAGNKGQISEGEIDTILGKYGAVSVEGEEKVLTTSKGYVIKISDIWSGILTGENAGETVLGEETTTEGNTTLTVKLLSTKEPVIADGTNVKEIKQGAPIPEDFYYVGGMMDEGIVISDNSADENKGVDTELIGNQFVWVPVVQNQRIEIEIESDTEITELTIIDPLLDDITMDINGQEIRPRGTDFIVEVKPTINGEYTITSQIGEKTISQTLDISTLYAQDFWNMDIETAKNYNDVTIATYAPSVNKYGGFYIARYEAGCENARKSSSGTTDEVYSKKDMYPYNYMTSKDSINTVISKYEKTSVTTEIPNAATWDRTLNWLVETKAIIVNNTVNELENSINWGNYYDSGFEVCGKYDFAGTWYDGKYTVRKSDATMIGTGSSEFTKRNNLYDLAGNCREATLEDYKEYNIITFRGGDCGNGSSALKRQIGVVSSDLMDCSFRLVLYIN